MNKIKPIGKFLFIEVEPFVATTTSGIFLGELQKHEHPPRACKVLSLGSKINDEDVKVNGRYLFTGYANKEGAKTENGKEYRIVHLDDILMEIDDDTKFIGER